MRKGPGETYREQASKLYDMAKKWLKGCTTVDELLDAVVKEQLVDTMPQALKVWVNEREPSSSKEAGELADSYLQAREIERGGPEVEKGYWWTEDNCILEKKGLKRLRRFRETLETEDTEGTRRKWKRRSQRTRQRQVL